MGDWLVMIGWKIIHILLPAQLDVQSWSQLLYNCNWLGLEDETFLHRQHLHILTDSFRGLIFAKRPDMHSALCAIYNMSACKHVGNRTLHTSVPKLWNKQYIKDSCISSCFFFCIFYLPLLFFIHLHCYAMFSDITICLFCLRSKIDPCL